MIKKYAGKAADRAIWAILGPRRVFNWYNKCREIKQNILYDYPPDPTKTLYIDPSCIKINLINSYDQNKGLGRIYGGEWDKQTEPIEKNWIYKGLVQRYESNKRWVDTEYVHHAEKMINEGKNIFGYSDIGEFVKNRCRYVDDLYTNIKNEGYLSAKEASKVDENRHNGKYYPYNVEVIVGIGREGQIMFVDGYHRIAIARTLNIDEIPVQVVIRHKKWQKYIDKVRKNITVGDVNNHPDLQFNS